jgi:(p)ppGpp synthase/HD superfamily hydrolase
MTEADTFPDETLVATELGEAAIVMHAYRFARDAHAAAGQLRKYTREPYIVHPLAVANLVRSVPHTDAMLAAALLHAVVEDTPVRIEEIEARFGAEIGELVDWLTDVSRPEDGNRAVRKHLDLLHTAKATPEAKTIKLADLIDNTKTIASHDPGFWRRYRKEKLALLEVLREGDPTLWRIAAERC